MKLRSVICALLLVTPVLALTDTVTVQLVEPRYASQLVVSVNGKSGAVCSVGATNATATVVCRQLGLDTTGAHISQSYFYGGFLPFAMSKVHCFGNESSLADCAYEAIDPVCNEHWYTGIKCGSDPEPVGATNITVAIEGGGRIGRLLATVDGRVTGQVTSIPYYLRSSNIGKVVCRELGYEGSRIRSRKLPAKPDIPVVLSYLYCSGTETSLFDCRYNVEATVGLPIEVECTDMSIAIEGGGRKGRLLVTMNGETGLYCKDKANNLVATVACKDLGFDTPWAHVAAVTTPTSLPVVLDDAQCKFRHSKLVDCEFEPHNCTDTQGVGINCPAERPDVTVAIEGGGPKGRLLVTLSGQTGTICYSKYDNENIAEVACRELGFNTTKPIMRREDGESPYPTMISRMKCSETKTRLADCRFSSRRYCRGVTGINCSPVPTTITLAIEGGGSKGRLLATVDGQVGTVCRSSYYSAIKNENSLLAVVCKELGYNTSRAQVRGIPSSTTLPITLRDVQCTGDEQSLFNCAYLADEVCEHWAQDVEVDCSPVPRITPEIDGGGRTGRLVVTVDGRKGTVCSAGANEALAAVACRHLGWKTSLATLITPISPGGFPIKMTNVVCTGGENSLRDCTFSAASSCTSGLAVAVNCTGGPAHVTVQLGHDFDDGPKGLLLATVDYTKRTVCNDGATHAIAKVVCRELGFNSSWPRIYDSSTAWYMYWNSPLPKMDDVRCLGNENSLAECQFTTNYNCDHMEDIGVDCSDAEGPTSDVMITADDNGGLYASINATKGRLRLFGATNSILVTVCQDLGFNTTSVTTSLVTVSRYERCPPYKYNVHCTGTEKSLTECTFVTENDCIESTLTRIHCTPVEPVPQIPMNVTVAIEGSGPMGRLVATVNGRSGLIGMKTPSNAIAAVVCRELGWNTTIAHMRKFVRSPKMSLVLNDVYCTGSENKFADCAYTYADPVSSKRYTEASVTYDYYDIGIDCSPDIKVTVAMVGKRNAGRVIAKVNGVSGYVCSETEAVAAVVCRELGWNTSYSGFKTLFKRKYTVPWLPVVMHEVYCTGQETTLANCTFTIFGDCPESGPVEIICKKPRKVKVPLVSPKQVPLVTISRKTRSVSSGIGSRKTRSVSGETGTPLTITNLKRLGDTVRERLLANIRGKVGSFCYEGQDPKAVANVVCRELGEYTPRARLLKISLYTHESWAVRAEVQSCYGNESRLSDCSFQENPCEWPDDISPLCLPVPTFSIEGGGPRGRLIATVNLMPGTVCSSIANNALASVICRELGYNTDKAQIRRLSNKYTSIPIMLDDAHCQGTEGRVADCRYEQAEESCYDEYSRRIYYAHYTYSAHDLEIDCSQATKVTTAIEGGGRKGRLLATVHGKTGTVCNDGATHALAAVVCRELGLDTPLARITSVLAPSVLPIVMNEARCLGNETHLANCSFVTIHNCTHIEDVGVDCSPVPTVTVALEGGSREGRLLATVDGKTGTVCDDKATHAVAKVVCRELGFNTTLPHITRPTTSTTLPIVMDEVQCTGDENSLAECRFITDHNCDHSEDIAVRCPLNED